MVEVNLTEEKIVKSKAKTQKVLPIIIWFIVGILVGAGAFYSWNKIMVKPNKVVAQMEKAQIQELVSKVNKLIILPTGEEPVVATINDADALVKDQVFYKGAENGDVVLVYQKNAKAVVYSPKKNIIVNVGPVVFNNNQQQAPAPASQKEEEETPTKKN